MSESAKFESQKKSLQGICEENHLVFRFRADTYPITLTIRPTGGMDNQMRIAAMADEKGMGTHPDAQMTIFFEDGELNVRTTERFEISDMLLSKIKNIYRKMHSFWLQFLQREIAEKDLLRNLPRIEAENPADGDDGPAVKTTVDSSGLVTGVDFQDSDNEDEDSEGDYGYQEPGTDE